MKIKSYTFLIIPLIWACGSPESELEDAKKINSITAYEEFITKNPESSDLVEQAKDSIRSLELKVAINDSSIRTLEGYIKKYPEGKFTTIAYEKLQEFLGKIKISFVNKYSKKPVHVYLAITQPEGDSLTIEGYKIQIDSIDTGKFLIRNLPPGKFNLYYLTGGWSTIEMVGENIEISEGDIVDLGVIEVYGKSYY